MRRFVLGLAIVACTALLTAGAGAAPQAPSSAPAGEVKVRAKFELPASDGLVADVEAVGNEVTLRIDGDESYVFYEVRGEVSEEGMKASFGRLGQISFTFRPTSSESFPAGPGCKGERYTRKEGVFSGEANFKGERGFVTIDAESVPGKIRVDPMHCSRDRGKVASVTAGSQLEFAYLRASDGHGRYFAAKGQHWRGEQFAAFLAGLQERREGMKITRYSFGETKRRGAFQFDNAAGTATIRPHGRFTGNASFSREGGPKQPGRWRGTLSVSLLGHEPIGLAGPEFKATLAPRIPPEH